MSIKFELCKEQRTTGTIDIFDYQTANAAGISSTNSSLCWEMKTTGFYLKNSKALAKAKYTKCVILTTKFPFECKTHKHAPNIEINTVNITSHVLKSKQAGALKRTNL